MKILLTTRRELTERRNPIALLDLAPYWRRAGHEVDCRYLDQLGAAGAGSSYDLVGLSVLQALDRDAPVRDAIRLQRTFRTEVVVGGKWACTAEPSQKEALERHGIRLFDGPGEGVFDSDGIDFQNYPAWDAADFTTLADVRADIMSSRGCPFHCNFCHNTERRVRFFSAARTAENIRMLLERGVPQVFICDDIFTLKSSHMESVYEELRRRGVQIEGRSEFFTHVRYINDETAAWMKRFQPFRLHIGVESGDDRMLGLMGKGFDSRTAHDKIRMLHDKVGIAPGALFLIGFPGQTEESLKNTLEFIRKIRPFAGIWVSYYQPVPGTKGYQMALERTGRRAFGTRNTRITYVDPNLTRRMLLKYNYLMSDLSSGAGIRQRFILGLLDYGPPGLLHAARTWRQRRRLRDLTAVPLAECGIMSAAGQEAGFA